MPSLQDKTLAITRSRQDAGEFFQLVNAEGGKAISIPAIEIVTAGQDAVRQFIESVQNNSYDYCAFMSAQAVRVLFDLAGAKVVDVLKQTSIVAVGPKTKEALEAYGIQVGIMPAKFSSTGLVELMSEMKPDGKKIIIPRSGEANDLVANALSDLGMKVDEVFLYKIRAADVSPEWEEFGRMLDKNEIDAVIFTSASNVRSFLEIMKKMNKNMPKQVAAISIGPFTTAELAKNGIRCHEAEDHTISGTVQVAKKLLRHQE